jgi:hypothetical protein
MWHGVWWENLKKRWHSEVLNVDRRKMFYWALNRTGGRGGVPCGLGEAPVTATSEHYNGLSRPINSGTFPTLWETVGFPRVITVHFIFIYGFLGLLFLYLQFVARSEYSFSLFLSYPLQIAVYFQISLKTIFNRSPSLRSNWKELLFYTLSKSTNGVTWEVGGQWHNLVQTLVLINWKKLEFEKRSLKTTNNEI